MKARIGIAARLGICCMVCCVLLAGSAAWAEETSEYIHYQLGLKYKNEGKIKQAVDEFNTVLAEYPDNYNAYFHLAELRKEQNQPRLVIYNLKKALSYNPGWGRAQKMLAEAYAADGQYQQAIMELQQYRQTCDPQERAGVQASIDSLIQRTRGERLADAPEQAPAAVKTPSPAKKEAASRPASAAANNAMAMSEFQRGVELFGDKKFDEALNSFRKTLTLAPGFAGAYYYAGLIRYHKGQNDMAKFNLKKAFDYPARGVNAHFYLGKILGSEKLYKEAIDELTLFVQKTLSDTARKEAQALIEVFTSGLEGKAVELDKLGISSALSTWDKVERPGELKTGAAAADSAALEERGGIEVRIDSMLAMMVVDTLTNAGQAMLAGVRLFQDNQFDKAIAEFKKTLVAYPTGEVAVRSLYNIGVSYVKLRLFTNAENQFQQVLDRFGGHTLAANSLFLKAFCIRERGEYAVAERLLRDFILKHRGHAWCARAYEQLGDVYTDLEQRKKALDAYTQAAETAQNPTDRVYALYKQGTTYFAVGNPERAIASLKKVIEAGEKSNLYVRVPDSYYRIADYWYQQKKYAQAQPFYQTVTRKYPQYQETPWGLFQMAGIHKNLKDYKNAVAQYKDLIARYPDDYWARQARWKLEDTVWESQYRAVLQ